MDAQEKTTTSSRYNLISAIFAFALWGSWAYYINQGATQSMSVVAGLTQGVASFTITLLIVRLVTLLFHRLQPGALRLFLAPVATTILTGSYLTTIHYLVGTPEIFLTILPALTIALAFSFLTSWKLHKANKGM